MRETSTTGGGSKTDKNTCEEIVELGPLDAIRVAPEVTRAFEAGPDGIELLVFGPRCDGDGEVLMGWWAD